MRQRAAQHNLPDDQLGGRGARVAPPLRRPAACCSSSRHSTRGRIASGWRSCYSRHFTCRRCTWRLSLSSCSSARAAPRAWSSTRVRSQRKLCPSLKASQSRTPYGASTWQAATSTVSLNLLRKARRTPLPARLLGDQAALGVSGTSCATLSSGTRTLLPSLVSIVRGMRKWCSPRQPRTATTAH